MTVARRAHDHFRVPALRDQKSCQSTSCLLKCKEIVEIDRAENKQNAHIYYSYYLVHHLSAHCMRRRALSTRNMASMRKTEFRVLGILRN